MRVYYTCTLYEDIEGDTVPVDKARMIANKLDDIGIAKFEIVIQQDPQPPANQRFEE